MELMYHIHKHTPRIDLWLNENDVQELGETKRIPEDIMSHPFVEVLPDNHEKFDSLVWKKSTDVQCICERQGSLSDTIRWIYIKASLFDIIQSNDISKLSNILTNEVGITLYVNQHNPHNVCLSKRSRTNIMSTIQSFITHSIS